jgi:glycosyltransferase involved in cell wall biosynthesis
MPTIAFITDNFQVGIESGYGGSQYLAGLTERLNALDVHCRIVTRGHDVAPSVIGIGPPYARKRQLDKLTFSRHLWNARARFDDVQLIHSQSASSIPFLHWMRKLGKPTIFDCRTSLVRTTRLLSAYQLVTLAMFRPSTVLVCDQVSAADSERFLRLRPPYLPVPVEVPDQQPGDVATDVRNAVFAGQLARDKGFLELTAAVMTLWAQGETFKLHIVGDGPLRAEAARFAARMPDNVVLHGLLAPEATRRVIAQADALIHPSHTEGVSRSVLEAMSLGVPALACNVGGMADLAEKDLFEVMRPRRPHTIAAAFRRLSHDRNRRADLSRRAWRHVRDHHRWDTVFARLTTIYTSLGVSIHKIETTP